MIKTFTVKIYDFATGAYLKTVNPEEIINEPKFSSKIGGGQGQCVIELSLPFDDFGEGTVIKAMNVVKIYEQDDTFNTSPVLIYTGFISQYTPKFSGSNQSVELSLLGLVSLLSYAVYRDGSANPDVVITGVDPAEIMRYIVTHFNTIYPNSWITYGANVVDVGGTASFTFQKMKWIDALKAAFNLSKAGRYWTVRENGELYYKEKPSSRTHLFHIGHDIESGQIVKNSEKIVNRAIVHWASGTTTYEDATSISTYGRRESFIDETTLADLTSANGYGNGLVAEEKDQKSESRLRINNRYNIETIHPGDTCSVVNTKKDSTVFETNMLITSVTYGPDGVDIELNNDLPSFADIFKDAVKKQIDAA